MQDRVPQSLSAANDTAGAAARRATGDLAESGRIDGTLQPNRIAITSVFGDPLHPRTWSGAPRNIAEALRQLDFDVVGIHPRLSRGRLLWYAGRHLLAGYGRIDSTETVIRGRPARAARARELSQALARLGIDRVLHTGTLDLPMLQNDPTRHYLFCDHTWNLAVRHRPAVHELNAKARAHFEQLERESYAAVRHIFTFAQYVRDDLIAHYGVPRDRVTAVGSGMGNIQPYDGPKDYVGGPLLFVAKHLFAAKGGRLVLDAFRRAHRQRPDLKLVMVANPRDIEASDRGDGITIHQYLPWNALQELFRSAALLVQPMLNDPWGQVYLEAMTSRTPVLGLHRNGLPEITEDGQHGFLVPSPDPEVLAEAILDAMSDPDELARKGKSGQQHVLRNYSWDRVAQKVAATLQRP